MILVYTFIGKLPHYCVDTVKHARVFFSGEIVFIIDDMNSKYIDELKKYSVKILPYEWFTDAEFTQTVQDNYSRFCIAENIGDRKLLFIRSFERFFVLEKFLRIYPQEDVLFLELDMLIFFKPEDLLPKFRTKEITFSRVQNKHMCSAFCYVKSVNILHDLNTYFLEFIKHHTDFISEMGAIGEWLEKPENRARALMLPGLWKDERYAASIWENFEYFNQELFDGLGIGIRVGGPDETHRNEWFRRGQVWWGNDVMYNEYNYEWRFIDGIRYLYLKNEKGAAFKVNCIHVHCKYLEDFVQPS